MKAKLLVLAAALVLGMIALAGDKTEPEAAASPLQKRVDELEARVKALELRLDKLAEAKNPPAAIVPLPRENDGAPTLPIQPFPGGSHGPIWGQGRINGWDFYIVPCAGGSPAPAR